MSEPRREGIGGRRLTKRTALHVLIEHAIADCKGAGCGIRSLPSDTARRRVREAIVRVHREAYGRDATEDDLRRLGFW